jgi:predicted ester cyclase
VCPGCGFFTPVFSRLLRQVDGNGKHNVGGDRFTGIGDWPRQLRPRWIFVDAFGGIVNSAMRNWNMCSMSELQSFAEQTFATIPDFRLQLTSRFASGDRGAIEWTMSGTQKVHIPGLPATGKSFSALRAVTIVEFRAGKIESVPMCSAVGELSPMCPEWTEGQNTSGTFDANGNESRGERIRSRLSPRCDRDWLPLSRDFTS